MSSPQPLNKLFLSVVFATHKAGGGSNDLYAPTFSLWRHIISHHKFSHFFLQDPLFPFINKMNEGSLLKDQGGEGLNPTTEKVHGQSLGHSPCGGSFQPLGFCIYKSATTRGPHNRINKSNSCLGPSHLTRGFVKFLWFVTLLDCFGFAASESGGGLPLSFARRFQFDGTGCSNFQWTVDREELQLTAQWKSEPGAQWTAFGISENGGMKGADIVMVQVGQDGSFAAHDMFSTQFGLPALDLLQNVKLLEATYDNEDRLQVTIKRAIDTCDSQDIAVESHKQYLICASGHLSDDGVIQYHGLQRATGVVNLMVDESLFARDWTPSSANISKTYLGMGLIMQGDLNTAMAPLPLDIQMTNVSIVSLSSTNYRCRAFRVTQQMTFTALEGVRGDGRTPRNGDTNEFLHHTILFHCDNPTESVFSQIDRDPWDCIDEMPACKMVASYAVGAGLFEAPTGLHFSLMIGVYVLLIHYENPYGKPIMNDTSGLRLWINPPAITNTKPAQVGTHVALLESITIPADPEQKEITLQYLISAEATMKVLPPGGVQAFGSVLHMHELGVRGRVGLIRNGTHIMDVYNHNSFDFHRQSFDFTRWKFLPGDALVISCTYKPLTTRDSRGGLRTADEMCSYFAVWSPATPNYGTAMGSCVKEGEPFLNSHIGNNITVHSPIPNSLHEVIPLSSHRKNTCKTFVMEDVSINEITYADPAIYAQLMIIAAFAAVSVLSTRRVLVRLRIETSELREQRNAVVYIGQLLFSTVVLPILCWDLASIFPEDTSMDAVDPNQHVMTRGIIVTQAILYLLELFYRIGARWSLILHHLMTSSAVIYLNVVGNINYNILCLKVGICLALLAVTEQPLYIILLLRLAGYGETGKKSWPIFCYIASFLFIVVRVLVVLLVTILLTQQSSASDIAWNVGKVSFSEWNSASVSFFSSPTVVRCMVVILLLGILLSNYFAVRAMLYMAKPKLKKEPELPLEPMTSDLIDPTTQDDLPEGKVQVATGSLENTHDNDNSNTFLSFIALSSSSQLENTDNDDDFNTFLSFIAPSSSSQLDQFFSSEESKVVGA